MREIMLLKQIARAATTWVAAVIILLGLAFVLNALTPEEPHKSPSIEKTAYEVSPGPYGSGVLGDWTGMSHGLYCFQPGTVPDTSKVGVSKASSPASSAGMACQGEDIRIYGDSITNGGKTALAAQLNAKGLTVFVDAWSGRPTTPAVDALVAETNLPMRVIMATGTNDIFNPTVMGAQVQRAENYINSYNAAHGTKVQLFWVNVQATRWGQSDAIERNDQRNSMSINMDIYQRIPNANVISWAERFMDHPGLLNTYLADGVHPKAGTGYAYWAAIIVGWLKTYGGL